MVLQTALQKENPNHDNDLGWSSKHERQLERSIFDRLHCFKLTILLKIIVKESYETSWTVNSIASLAKLSGFSVSTVRRYLVQLEERRFIRRARMMSRHTHRDSVYTIVVNWCRIGYHPPRTYDISSLQKLQHINLIKPGDRFWINGIMQSHNKARAVYKSKPKNRSFFERFERTGGNTIKPPKEINELPTKIRKEKKIDNQSFALAMLIDNLATEFLSRLDFWGFDRKSYLSNDENRRIIHRAYCQTLWDMHRMTPHDAFLNTCLYALSNQSLFPKYSTAMRLRHNFSTIGAMQKSGLKLIVQNTHIDRLEQYKACYETNNEK